MKNAIQVLDVSIFNWERKQLEGLKVIWLRKLSVFLLEQNTELSKLSSVKN